MSTHQHVDALTERETEVLQLLVGGKSNKEIAESLFIEVSTVKWFNSQIYDKLGVRNRKQAVIRARTIGILESDENDPLHAPLHNLPADTLPFIGRQQEIEHLVEQLTTDAIRHITILGSGGMGKTRLSIEVGRRLLAAFRDGVYFISLAPVTSREQIVTMIAEAVKFKFHSDKQAEQQLLSYLQSKQMLLIVDNFEHLVGDADLLTDTLTIAPHVKILVTSREKLLVSGEVIYLISGLSLSMAESADAVRLFVEAAKRIPIQLNENDLIQAVSICQMLGGMPLAILLAAAWLDTLSVLEIKVEIQSGLDILAVNLRDVPERHQSIEAVFGHSWKRLTEQEQAVFMKLSVFRGGFTREAAQTVTGASIQNLKRLVHTSFIQHLPSGRYAIHELMRQFGEVKLRASDEYDSVCDNHALFFADFINPLSAEKWGTGRFDDILEQIHEDFDNVRLAWQYQADSLNTAELRRFLDGLWIYFDSYSRSQEGVDLFEPVRHAVPRNNEAAELFYWQISARYAWMLSDLGQPQQAVNLQKQALDYFSQVKATHDMLFVYRGLFFGLRSVNSFTEGISYAQRGLDLAKAIDSSEWIMGFSIPAAGRYIQLERYDEALKIAESQPDSPLKVNLLPFLLIKMEKYTRAEALVLVGLEKFRFHRIGYMLCYRYLAECRLRQQDYETALKYIIRGLQYVDAPGYAWGILRILVIGVQLLIAEANLMQATTLLSVIANHPSATENTKAETMNDEAALSKLLTHDEFEAAWERGKRLNLDDVITDLMER